MIRQFKHRVYWPYEKTLEVCIREAGRSKMTWGMFPDHLVGYEYRGWNYWFGGPLHELLEQDLPVTRVVLPGGRIIKTKAKEFIFQNSLFRS